MFFLGRGSTPFDELYGFTDLLIDLDLGLYELIDIHEVSTLNPKKTISPIKIKP